MTYFWYIIFDYIITNIQLYIYIYIIWPVTPIINTLHWYGISVVIYELILMLLTKIHALFTFSYINFFCLPYGLPPYHFILIICHVVLGFWVLNSVFLVLMTLTILEILVRYSVMSLCRNLLMFTSWLDWDCGMERRLKN